MTVRLIDQPADFDALLREIEGAPRVALDTEAASFHRYHDRIYLIQLSTPDLTVVIDPLGVGSLEAIGAILADPATEKIFHDADYDLRLFHKEFGFTATRLFDTRIAAQLLGEPGIGLAALLEKYFGVRPDKRFQRADWSIRPLSPAMLDYAAGDTHHLEELRALLLDQLIEKGRASWATEEFARLDLLRSNPVDDDPATGYLRLKGAKTLERRAMAILRELYNWREATASRLDRSSFRVMGNEVLFELAQRPVRTLADLGRVKGIGRDVAERRGGEVLAAIERGLAIPDSDLPRIERPPRRAPDLAWEARVEALKKTRNRLAEELGLQPGVLCPNGTLEAIARVLPEDVAAMAAIEEVRRWQAETIGAALLETLRTLPESGQTQ